LLKKNSESQIEQKKWKQRGEVAFLWRRGKVKSSGEEGKEGREKEGGGEELVGTILKREKNEEKRKGRSLLKTPEK